MLFRRSVELPIQPDAHEVALKVRRRGDIDRREGGATGTVKIGKRRARVCHAPQIVMQIFDLNGPRTRNAYSMPPPAVQPLKFCDPDPVAGPKNWIVHVV